MDPDDIDAPLRVVAVRMEEGLINKISLFVTVNCVKPVGGKDSPIKISTCPLLFLPPITTFVFSSSP